MLSSSFCASQKINSSWQSGLFVSFLKKDKFQSIFQGIVQPKQQWLIVNKFNWMFDVLKYFLQIK